MNANCLADDSHEISSLIFSDKQNKKKKEDIMSSAANLSSALTLSLP